MKCDASESSDPDSKLQQVDQEAWFDTLTQIQKYILKGSEILRHSEKISESEFQVLRMSVIEREFTKGIVEARDVKDDCFAFVRWVRNSFALRSPCSTSQGHPQHELLGHGESLAVRGHHQGRVCG